MLSNYSSFVNVDLVSLCMQHVFNIFNISVSLLRHCSDVIGIMTVCFHEWWVNRIIKVCDFLSQINICVYLKKQGQQELVVVDVAFTSLAACLGQLLFVSDAWIKNSIVPATPV